jgi:hypothetical protein
MSLEVKQHFSGTTKTYEVAGSLFNGRSLPKLLRIRRHIPGNNLTNNLKLNEL